MYVDLRRNVGTVEVITGTDPEAQGRALAEAEVSPLQGLRPLTQYPIRHRRLLYLYVPAAQSLSSGDFNTSTSSSRTENVAVQSTDVTSPSL